MKLESKVASDIDIVIVCWAGLGHWGRGMLW